MLEHHKACCRFFVLVVSELTVAEREQSILLRKEVREHLNQVVVLVLIDFTLPRNAPVHEDVTLATMPVHVTEEDHLILTVVGSH